MPLDRCNGPRPNFLFILCDQLRHDWLGFSGASQVCTTAIDGVASRGMRFTQCTTNSPVCAPARIGLSTGLQPYRVGALDNSAYLPQSVPTYYQRLRDHGYRVGCVGKLDLAKPDPFNGRYGERPCAYGWGFTQPVECEGKQHAGRHNVPVGPYTTYLAERGLLAPLHDDYDGRRALKQRERKIATHDSVLPLDAYEDIYVGRRAVEWIDRYACDFPWHLLVSFVGPHPPFDPPSIYADRCRDRDVPLPVPDSLEGKARWVQASILELPSKDIAVIRRQYCAMIELIDDQIAMILSVLKARHLLDSTYVIFTVDHGEMLGDHGLWAKNVAYEPALRVPLVFAGPGIDSGTVFDGPVELIDVGATICELAGLPAKDDLDARSVVPILGGERSQHRSDAIASERNFRCIRTRQHKFIQNYNDIDELYDLEQDPFELENIALSKPELVSTLRRRMVQRFTEGKWLR